MPRGIKKQRKSVPMKPIKIAALVITAIENLRETKGSTSGKIVDYITLASDLPLGRIKPQVNAALKRGVEYGILKRYRGHYFLPTGDDLDRADKIATRFARLPTPVPSRTTNEITSPEVSSNRKVPKVRPKMTMARKPLSNLKKNVRKARSMPLSLTSTVTEKSYYRDNESSSLGSHVD